MKKTFWDGFLCGVNPCTSIAWALYWLGDFASWWLQMRDGRRWVGFWYPVYDGLMRWSVKAQSGSGCGPWGPVEPNE